MREKAILTSPDGAATEKINSGNEVTKRDLAPTLQVQIEFVYDAANLTIDEEKPVKEIGIDEDDVAEHGGQAETRGMDSCVAYALCIFDEDPTKSRVYVGHFNSKPGSLKWEKNEDPDVLYRGVSHGTVKAFLLGGDGWPLSDELIQIMLPKLEPMLPRSAGGIPIFCNVSSQFRKQLKSDIHVLPQASGICIDASTNRVRILFDEETVLSAEDHAYVEEVYSPKAE